MPGHTPPRSAAESLFDTAEDRRSIPPIEAPRDRRRASGRVVCQRQEGFDPAEDLRSIPPTAGRRGGALFLPETGA